MSPQTACPQIETPLSGRFNTSIARLLWAMFFIAVTMGSYPWFEPLSIAFYVWFAFTMFCVVVGIIFGGFEGATNAFLIGALVVPCFLLVLLLLGMFSYLLIAVWIH